MTHWFEEWHGAKLPATVVSGLSTAGGSTNMSTGVQNALSTKASLNSGLVPTAQLGSSVASTNTFLRGEQIWSVVQTTHVNGLDSTLAELALAISTKAAGAHTHPQADISSLAADLSSLAAQISTKAAGAHTHAQADISSLVSDLSSVSAQLSTKASLNSGKVPTGQLGSGVADGTKFLRGDQTWAVPSAAVVWSSVTFNFSYPPQGTKLFTVTDATVNSSSAITFEQKSVLETNDNAADSDPVWFFPVPGAGSFLVYVRGVDSPVGGQIFAIYQVSN